MVSSLDPVGTGFVQSLARPGGNITGLNVISPELSGKRLQLLKETVPKVSRVAFLWSPDSAGAKLDYKEIGTAAKLLKLHILSLSRSPTRRGS
jgi:putative ABC transport system substrate-binding protein